MHVLLKKVCANFHKNVVVSIKANINAKKQQFSIRIRMSFEKKYQIFFKKC